MRGRDNCIVWNGIHHKTNTEGGSSYYGFPDDTYFNRVKIELADKGVVIESLIEVRDASLSTAGMKVYSL